MERIIVFIQIALFCIGGANAAVRDGNAMARGASTPQRVTTTTRTDRAVTNRETVLAPTANRAAKTQSVSPRSTTSTQASSRAATARAATAQPTSSRTASVTARAATTTAAAHQSQTARAASSSTIARDATESATTQTRTGTEYEICKTAYFTCMDQFCSLKNDDYRRCSCSNRVNDLTKQRATLQDAGEQLTVFNENLDVVGMTAAQAAAMKTASAGENALTSDSSASKALLQAIMNSIRGEDSSVGGKYSDLNSITMVFDTSNAFGVTDTGQIIASYNGQNLYDAVYPQCRNAVRADCNDASLQRAVTAYLMAVEQDCNTVQTAVEETQKKLKSAVRESSAMLDLARVENRRNHNADTLAACIANVESAILSEEVCGAGYHKCLDNGEFIDVTTGAPIAGVVKFYQLQELLKFADGVQASDQQLSRIPSNRMFVQNFEKRTKKFAEPALDKCVEQADDAWAEYLDKAMLDIYYAQRAKVAEIKQGCFDFISGCYTNGETALTAAMAELIGDAGVIFQPDAIALTKQMCTDYVQSCNNMFGEQDIIAEYVQNRQDTDRLAACRAVAKQCFDKFGGTAYENFYYPYSGLFKRGAALDWFTLYEYSEDGTMFATVDGSDDTVKVKYKSECAKQLTTIDACNDQQLIEQVFGGFDYAPVCLLDSPYKNGTNYNNEGPEIMTGTECKAGKQAYRYGRFVYDKPTGRVTDIGTGIKKQEGSTEGANTIVLKHHLIRSVGVATEVYNQVLDVLSTNCTNLDGRFMELQWLREPEYYLMDGSQFSTEICLSHHANTNTLPKADFGNMPSMYGMVDRENMCPKDYIQTVDVQSWGACLCWENGGRRSRNGYSPTCIAGLPINGNSEKIYELKCIDAAGKAEPQTLWKAPDANNLTEFTWCIRDTDTKTNQVCGVNTTDGKIPDTCPTNNYLPLAITYDNQ